MDILFIICIILGILGILVTSIFICYNICRLFDISLYRSLSHLYRALSHYFTPKATKIIISLFIFSSLFLFFQTVFSFLTFKMGPAGPDGAKISVKLGILSLGIFIGWLLELGLKKSGPTLKASLTAIGAALGSGPMFFLKEMGPDKWDYPIGLLIGLIWHRLDTAINILISGEDKDYRLQRIFAWIDIIVIAVVTLAVSAYLIMEK